MASLRTEITEIVTGLGTLGTGTLEQAMVGAGPPPQFRNVDNSTWQRLKEALDARAHEAEFLAAFNNGRYLLAADDGLRGRIPRIVEWKGAHRDPADDPVPADLRIDHVYLVSCKYLSKVMHNASPWTLFDRCLQGAQGTRSTGDWYSEVAPAEHQALYGVVRRLLDGGERLPEKVSELNREQRRALASAGELNSAESARAYGELIERVSIASAQRWRLAMGCGPEDGSASRSATRPPMRSMLWRLLRLSSTPYFVLGTGAGDSLRLRVCTPWDWAQAYELCDFQVAAEGGGQPRVRWQAIVRARDGGAAESEVCGHVEVRWSHGRLGGNPEAKVYLDTPHRLVPGYLPLI